MAANVRSLRRGLPRTPGGAPWPPTGAAPAEGRAESVGESSPSEAPAGAVVGAPGAPAPVSAPAASSPVAAAIAPAGSGRRLRSGLPRVRGGGPWPAAGEVSGVRHVDATDAAAAPRPGTVPAFGAVTEPVAPAAEPTPRAAHPATAPASSAEIGGGLRRGLPRIAGGEPWPPASAVAPIVESVPVVPASPMAATEPPADAVEPAPEASVRPAVESAAREAVAAPVAPVTRLAAPSAPPGAPPSAGPEPGPTRSGPRSVKQWVGASVVGVLAIIGAATIVVQLTRWFIGLDFMQDFLVTYPGETPLPEGAPVGLPAWLGWQHFFNVFLIVLIIRSGLRVRTEQRPPAYWTPRWAKGGQGRISLNLWFHQSLDILWLVNGLVFVVLLFATGQWMRVVPTSWEVVPNAISAGLQYLSLDWPLENGWVNYNSLQVLAYFATIFIAAPLAALTGVRMSGLWPKNATALDRRYPVEWARAVHFPVMVYFVAFIAVHVALVLLTGALRNLNHMYAAQDAGGWLGFWLFVASLVVIAAAWVAARPSLLAPIAGLFGKVGR